MSDELIVVKPGAVLQDRYEIVERVARGGFAIVWRAHDRLLGKDVALKVLHHAIADDDAAVEELKQETLRSRELTHENIVQVYDFLRDGDVVAIAMEYIEGETLSALAAKRPGQCFEPDDLAAWLGDICDALEYAHAERGKKRTVVHHDLKPGNFMVDRYGTVKVLDFGISKTITETQIHHTGQFVVAGTPPYMSPQQLKGQRPCPSDDVYSFGATLYALLTGKPPFFRGDIQLQIPSEIPPSMTERRREFELDLPPVPDDWEKVVAGCLAKDAAGRPGSMGEIALALGVREPSSRRSVRLSEAPGATKVLDPPPTGSRSRRPIWIGAGAVVLVAAGAAAFLLPREDAPEPAIAAAPPPATQPVTVPDPEPAAAETRPETAAPDDAEARRAADREATEAVAAQAEQARAREIDRLRDDVRRALDDGRWNVALSRASRLIEMAPEDAQAKSWQDRARRELRAIDRVSALRDDVETALRAERWDDAATALESLREASPSDPDLDRWTSRVEAHFAVAERVARLEADIPAAITSGSWSRAADLLEQLEVHAPEHAEAEAWHGVVDGQLQVRQLVERYRAAQEALDADAYRSLWLSLSDSDLQKIRRSYGDIRSQRVTIDGVEAAIDRDTARVTFRESRHFDLKAGGGHDVQAETRLTLRRTSGAGWKIAARTLETGP